MKPNSVRILGKQYSIEYCDKPSDVDILHYKSLWGQIDHWTTSIRIYDKDRQVEDIWGTLWHEILHGIDDVLHLGIYKELGDDTIDLLGMAISDVLFRNDWIKNNETENS